MTPPVRILLLTGSTRGGSTNTAALRTAHQLAPDGVTTVLYPGLAQLPPFNPDADHEPLDPLVADLRRRIAEADAVLLCTPEYAGALPGTFKNLLDWTVGGSELYEKPVAWINVAAEGRGEHAHASLRLVLGYLNAAVIEDACRRVPVPRAAIDDDGLVADPAFRAGLLDVLTTVRDHLTSPR